ncbi:hypothetical protein PVAND_012509 [Polypedilum vanderplanki]|uniref:Uncharacterized protein n=1 Tax=Polypedilum vanderplanki TaxID=319348 RepID=A0A9J6CMM6_POLVA|nr:hypothetical protein PVAND_012509 [Polypedilum vanderplanki]
MGNSSSRREKGRKCRSLPNSPAIKQRQLPVYTKTANGATAIPMPATVLVTRRCPPDKVRPLPPTPNHQSSLTKTASGSPSNESSRPNSPPDNTSKNGIRGSKIPSGPYSTQNGSNVSLLTNANLQQQEQIQQAQQTPTKQSMLGKLKLFAGKEKSSIESPKTQLSKRTSSSSGFSSARSERSDSSISLNNESSTNIPTSQSSSSNKSISTNKKSDTAKVTKTSTKVPTTTSMSTAKKGDKKDKSEQQTSNGTDISPTSKMHKIPQAKLQVPAAVVGRKTESKTGLSQPQQQSQTKTSTSVSTSIPKPMAAIKGTSKAIESEKQPDDLIKEKVSISVTSEKTQIVNPLHNHQLINGSNDIAIVNDQSLPASDIYRDTTNNIYQMQSHTNSIASRKLENFNDPLLINGNKFGMVQTTIFEEDKEGTAQAIVPMRSLMRGFNNHMSSPSRMNRTTINGTGYYDENGQGYCSDGDAFRKSTIRYSDIENGYLSEGPHFLSILRNRPQMPTTIAEER